MTIVFLKKEKVLKALSKGGYMWIYFGFCWIDGGPIFGWWWVVVDFFGWW